MASLNEWAQAARADAERARLHSVELRMEVRRQVRASEEQRAKFEAAVAQARSSQEMTFRTPWSGDLLWRRLRPEDEPFLELVKPR
jgi:hypothetical protein